MNRREVNRHGESFVRTPGAQFDCEIWKDQRGRYVFDGAEGVADFVFHLIGSSRCGRFVLLRCKCYRPPVLCPVRAKIRTTGAILWVRGEHNHLPEHATDRSQIRGGRRRRLRGGRTSTANFIVSGQRELHLEVAEEVLPLSLRCPARGQTSAVRLDEISSLLELHSFISKNIVQGFTQTQDGERLQSFHCPERDSLILTTRRLLDLLPHANMIHTEVSYKIAPGNHFSQQFRIHANWDGYVGLVACVLMKSSAADAYKEVFRLLNREVSNLSLPAYMDNFDAAIRSAMKSELPDARVYGCFFHYVRCLSRHASRPAVGLANDLRRRGEISKAFLSFTALPLLPPEEIPSAFSFFSEAATQLDPRFQRLIDYIDSYWLKTIGPVGLSVYRAPSRTNDALETNGAILLNEVSELLSSIWDLIAIIVSISQSVFEGYCCHLDDSQNNHSGSPTTVQKNETKIEEAWDLLDMGLISSVELVERLKYRTGAVIIGDSLLHKPDEEGNLQAWIATQISQHDHDYYEAAPVAQEGDHSYSLQPL